MSTALLSLLVQTTTDANNSTQGSSELLSGIGTGAILGFVATLLSSFGLLYLRRKHRRDRLRRAIIAELEKQDLERIVESLQMDETTDIDTEDSEEYPVRPSDLPPADSIPTSIYEGNTGNLGTLPEKEVSEVVEYYSSLLALKSIIQAVRNEESVLSADKKELHDELPNLESDRKELLTSLRVGLGILCGSSREGNCTDEEAS
ncbi:hypothetical protein [Natrinema gari]|uniref:hypothetical protein n=1 Tax=Natrinema gari TaxID=419186 RepID=UPI001268DE4B|nr:hypothetical protein [Natrinema gari]